MSPNKKLILAIGVVLGVALGGLAVVIAEFLDRSVRSAADLAKLVGDTPLVTVPTLVSPSDVRRAWTMRLASLTLVVATAVGGLAYVNQSVIPLGDIGFQARGWADAWIAENIRRPTVSTPSDQSGATSN